MKKTYKILIGIVALVIVIRLVLPYVVLHYANKTLADMNGYFGHIDNINLSIYRGAYTINNIYLHKVDTITKTESDFFRSDNIELSVEWRALFRGSIVGELKFDSPVLIFTKDKVELGDLKKDTADFRKLLNDFMPLKVNRFEVINGNLHYTDNTSKPKVDIALKQLHIIALNLSNVINEKIELPSTITASGAGYEGTLTFDMKLNPLTEQPNFDLNAEMQNINLVLLNDFLKAYGNFDVNKGTFGLYTEMAAKEGKFKGYVKPIIKNLAVVGIEDRNDSFFQKIWESLVGTVGVVFRNQEKKQLATKVYLEGDFKDPQTNTIQAIWEVLRNAFIQALLPNIDHQINLKSVNNENSEDKRNLLQRIFKSGNKTDEKKNK